jgi:hypothetical protein
MRCVIVNGAKLKAQACCAHCGEAIGGCYIREIGSRRIYCDFHCYSVSLKNPVLTRGYPLPALGAWTGRS